VVHVNLTFARSPAHLLNGIFEAVRVNPQQRFEGLQVHLTEQPLVAVIALRLPLMPQKLNRTKTPRAKQVRAFSEHLAAGYAR
jgi:hypothetical protein